jgi:hypothetical protein
MNNRGSVVVTQDGDSVRESACRNGILPGPSATRSPRSGAERSFDERSAWLAIARESRTQIMADERLSSIS